MTRRRGWRHRTGAVGIGLAVLGGSAPSVGAAESPVPVLGQALVTSVDATAPPVVLTIHGVRRIGGATVVYFSAGASTGSGDIDFVRALSIRDNRFGHLVGPDLSTAAVIDPATKLAYVGMRSGESAASAVGSSFATQQMKGPAGKAYVGYTEVAGVPASTRTVTVYLGGQLFPGVPVEDGPMTPTLPQTQINRNEPLIVLGTGWPTPATTNKPVLGGPRPLPQGADQAPYILPITLTTTSEGGAVADNDTSIDLTADILFRFDKADLTPAGIKAVAAAADKIKARKVSGTIRVTGHTDNKGSPAYNLDLSKRRAETVAAALRKALPGITLTVAGRGEADPIATNRTDSGRAKNRRVTLTLPKGS